MFLKLRKITITRQCLHKYPNFPNGFLEACHGVWEGKGYICQSMPIRLHQGGLTTPMADLEAESWFGWWQLRYFFVHPEKWGRFSPILTVAYFFSNGLVQPPTRFCLDGFYLIGMFFLYKDLSRATGLKLGGICLDDCWVNRNILDSQSICSYHSFDPTLLGR